MQGLVLLTLRGANAPARQCFTARCFGGVGGVGTITVTMTVAVAVPASFVAVMRYVVVFAGETSIDPSANTPPTGSMVANWTPLTLHCSVDVPPGPIAEGVAVNERICGTSITLTVTAANESPAFPTAVIVYVVVVVGKTSIEPLGATNPTPWSIKILREFETDQNSVAGWPATINDGFSRKLMIGRLVTVTVT